MATTRPFAYNPTPSTPINGTNNVGNVCVGVSALDYGASPGTLKWWMGPDEDNSYVICKDVSSQTFPTQLVPPNVGGVQFWRSTNTDEAFRGLVQTISGTPQYSAPAAATWLSSNGYWSNRPSAVAPVNTVAPVVTYNNLRVGGQLNTTTGTWSNLPNGFDCQWFNVTTGNPIPGAVLLNYFEPLLSLQHY